MRPIEKSIDRLLSRLTSTLVCSGIAALCTFSGCSFLFVQSLPPEAVARPGVTCTTNITAPVVDTVFTGTNVVAALFAAQQDDITNKGARVGLGLSVAVLWALSAAHGYRKTGECQEWQDELSHGVPEPSRYLWLTGFPHAYSSAAGTGRVRARDPSG